MSTYTTIVFLNGYDDEMAESFLNDQSGDITEEQMIDYLSQWDYGEYHETYDHKPWGSSDTVYEPENSEYTLSYNTGLGYVALTARIESEE